MTDAQKLYDEYEKWTADWNFYKEKIAVCEKCGFSQWCKKG